METGKRRCVFFDRDGIVNVAPQSRYVERWEDFRLQPEFVAALRIVRSLGYEAVVVTNQKGVSKGIMTRAAVDSIHERLKDLLSREHALQLLDILYCPHGDGECTCRKPQPGMFLEAARRHGIDLLASWMVGDQERDVEAGRRAGCRTILVEAGDRPTAADHRFQSMSELTGALGRLLSDSGKPESP